MRMLLIPRITPNPLAATWLAAIILATSVSVDLHAETYHVAQTMANASDANPGTEATPWKTISRAVTGLKPGDTVLVHSGVYREQVEIKVAGPAKPGSLPDAVRGLIPSIPHVGCRRVIWAGGSGNRAISVKGD